MSLEYACPINGKRLKIEQVKTFQEETKVSQYSLVNGEDPPGKGSARIIRICMMP